jgi:hypothetical protein
MIESYDFGKIKIDGEEYNHDVIIFDDGVKDWWRKDSHWVGISDLEEIIEKQPKTVIFGTGYSGIMEVSDEAKEHLEKLGIKVIIEPTKKACDAYNKLFNKESVIAALHLTC